MVHTVAEGCRQVSQFHAALDEVLPVHDNERGIHHRSSHIDIGEDVLHDLVNLSARKARPIHEETQIVNLPLGVLATPGIEHSSIEADEVVKLKQMISVAKLQLIEGFLLGSK